MFGSSLAKKLNKCLDQAHKAYEARQQKSFEQHVTAALELIGKHERESSLEFLVAEHQLGVLLIQARQASQGLNLIHDGIERAERFDQDKTGFYAMACRWFAFLLRQVTEGREDEGREALEKGLRRALEGDKQQLERMVKLLDTYLEELKAYKLSGLLPGLLRQAQQAYDSKVGANTMATGAMLSQFAVAIMDTDLPDGKHLALEATDRAHRILLEHKADEEELAPLVLVKASLLQDTGRADQAAELLRATASQVKGEYLASLAVMLARVELDRGQDPRMVEAIVQRGLEAAGGAAALDARTALLGLKGFCAGLRGDNPAVTQCVRQIEAALAETSRPGAADDGDCGQDETLLSQLEYVARGLYLGGFHENALGVIDHALARSGALETKYPEAMQEALARRALILSRLGRHPEAEALLFDKVLERLDDINRLDTRRHAEALIDLGDVWIETGDHGRAREALKSAWAMSAERDGKESEMAGHIFVMMGKLLLRMNQAAQAKETLLRGRAALLAHGAVGFRARAIFEEFKRLQSGTA